jgi:hypothetical protein
MKKNISLLLALAVVLGFTDPAFSQSSHGRIKVSADKYYLQYEDGTAFFWLGDTGWELFHRLNDDEISLYLENRRQKGFNLIQAVILAEFDGLRKPDPYGNIPLIDLDPEKPNEKYFSRVDKTVKLAASKNMIMGLLPTWGDKVTRLWGEGPVVFNEQNAYSYGLFLGRRYADAVNVVWILGGDRPALVDTQDWRPIWRSMARGILEGTKGKALITYHIAGGPSSTSQQIHNEPWLDINMMQSGHGGGHDVPVWNWITRDRALAPAKPTLDSEPNYEDHPVNPWPKWDPSNGYFRDYDVRKQIYRSVFAGGCGVTYGHHSVWQFWSPREEKINHADRYWTEALDRPGAVQAGYLRWLMESRSVIGRVPDQSIIVSGQGEKGEYMTAFKDAMGRYGMIYLPVGKEVSVDAGFIKGNMVRAWWFDPRNGKASLIGTIKRSNALKFTPPALGTEKDWVLILDDANEKFREPGKTK